MNLSSHEYVACQDKTHRPLILSEFTGAYTYSGFRSCLAVNPWDTAEVSSAIYEALTMPADEATRRWTELSSHVLSQSAQNWTHSLLSETSKSHLSHRHSLAPSKPAPSQDLIQSLVGENRDLVIVLDFEETLFVDDPAGNKQKGFQLENGVRELIGRLREKAEVWILSGKKRQEVEDLGEGVGIVADNGCEAKPPNGQWIQLTEDLDLEWRRAAFESLTYYTERTPGAFIEERGVTICWRYPSAQHEDADPEWGRRQAAECQNHIMDSIGERYSLHIVQGTSSFLIIPSSCSRSIALSHSLSKTQNLRNVLYVGRDGQVGEKLNELVKKAGGGKFVGVEVADGRNKTEAEWSVDGVEEAKKVLGYLL
ncbi:glycosyltransferase family 20 protein [Atractiella rhizophila]|nr:glycosyltransferase family 20 protein [Atractiella rhizophila]